MARKILVLGAGELGTAIVSAILDHKATHVQITSLTVAIRQETLIALNQSSNDESLNSKLVDLGALSQRGASFISINLVEDSEESLTSTFSQFTTIIHAGAMALPPGTQLRITKSALASKVQEYVPWQWGVDYDVIGPEAGGGLFAEAYQVRQLLRSQQTTKWWIVSCGIFMSFLFEEFWGVITRKDGKVNGMRALGSWDHLLTTTHVWDIAKVNANLILVDTETRDQAVHIAGVAMTYGELADELEKILCRRLDREVWTTDFLKDRSVKEPENTLLQYRVVFSGDQGLAWKKEGDYAETRGLTLDWNIEKFMDEYGIQ